uniref:Ribosomal_L2_C domain-containing protein n=1 Tax=Bursaphelenchus xylophilus TaxID=6326 RepID=A0A1I7S3I2_BURXY
MLIHGFSMSLNRLLATRRFLTPLKPWAAAIRGFPARGTKPLPRLLWDERDLKEITNNEYTPDPLRVRRLGGRDPETGRKVNQHIGGGVKFDYFMIDEHRRGPNEPGKTYDERVLEVRRDPNRTAHIALVAGARGKRWILATENMKAGQIISTSCYIPENPIIGIEGNAHPLGALSDGTIVNSIERYPTTDSQLFITNAGTSAQVVRRQGDFVVVRMPNKHEFSLHKTCMATVGRLSHGDWQDKMFGSANMHRRFGYKMSSGLWHKKDGYCGRKVRPLPPVRLLDEPPPAALPKQKFSMTKREQSALFGTAAVHPLVSGTQFRF